MASSSSSSLPFPKLTADTYTHWSALMESYLGGQDVWDAIEVGVDTLLAGATTVKAQREVCVKDKKALSYIQNGVDAENFERIITVKSAKAAWEVLKSTFKGVEKVQRVRVQTLWGEWEKTRMKEGEVVAAYVSRLRSIVNQFAHNGEKIPEVRIVEKILRSLDAKFDHIIVAIEETKDVSKLAVVNAQIVKAVVIASLGGRIHREAEIDNKD